MWRSPWDSTSRTRSRRPTLHWVSCAGHRSSLSYTPCKMFAHRRTDRWQVHWKWLAVFSFLNRPAMLGFAHASVSVGVSVPHFWPCRLARKLIGAERLTREHSRTASSNLMSGLSSKASYGGHLKQKSAFFAVDASGLLSGHFCLFLLPFALAMRNIVSNPDILVSRAAR